MLRQSISNLLIGFGLFLFCFSILLGLSEGILFVLITIASIILAVIWILKERSEKIFSIQTIVMGALIPLFGFLFLRFTEQLRFPLFLPDQPFLPFFLSACGFFSLGLIGLSLNTKARTLAFLFLTFAVVFLSYVPVAAMYKEPFFEFYTPINQRYPTQLALASLTFFVLCALSMLFEKFRSSFNALTKAQSVYIAMSSESEGILTPSTAPVANRMRLAGFLLILIGPLGFIGAAYVYHAPNFSMTGIMGNLTFLVNYLFVASISAALLIIGSAFTLYQKSKCALILVIIGSVTLVAAAFAFVYEAAITEVVFPKYPNLTSTHYETIFSLYALPLAIISALLCTLGLAAMIKARLSQKEGPTFRIRWRLTRMSGFVFIIFALLLVVPSTVGYMVLPKEILVENRWGYQEEISIQLAAFNSTDNSLQLVAVNIAPINQTISLLAGIVKDSQGNSVQTSSNLTPTELIDNQATEITVKLDSTLYSGTYNAALVTSSGGVFVSPSFIVP